MSRFSRAGVSLFLIVSWLSFPVEAQRFKEGAGVTAAQVEHSTFSLLGGMSAPVLKSIGLDPPFQASNTRLGEPFIDYYIPLDRLVRYSGTGQAEALLEPTYQILYPIVVAGSVRSSLTFVRGGGGYVPGPFGPAGLARALDVARTANPGHPPKSIFIVRIPALGIVLIGHRPAAGVLLLTPIRQDLPYPVQLGTPLQPANAVLAPLLPFARKVDLLAPS